MTAHPRICVLGGCGGAGASVLAAVLAWCATGPASQAFLIDCDPLGGGIDVLLGCERTPGSRWGQVRLRGGDLDPAVLRDCLPDWHQVSVLAVDDPLALDPEALEQLVAAAAPAGPVLLDLARWPSPIRTAALRMCDLVVLVTPAEVRAVDLPPGRIGSLLGLPVLGEFGYDPVGRHPGGLDPRRIRRGTRQLAEAVLQRAELDPVAVA
jgi:septum formation inhibitor-activating ATPase MinD